MKLKTILKTFFILAAFVATMPNFAADIVPNADVTQQGITITGTVTDEFGEPLPGVAVRIKGTTIGQQADLNGKFSITVPNREAVLEFSYIGFAPSEVTVGNNTVVNVQMRESVQQIDEVVVVAFGTQKKLNLTGAVGTASAADIESRPVLNATQALQGIVPGLNISQNSGMLDATASINVRGLATMEWSGNNPTARSGSPLILIDGMEGDLNVINPADIESISVLKDAAASSIYGSRAPFGVIIVTTKRGKIGKPIFTYNNSFQWKSPIITPDVMDSYTFALYFNDATYNSGQNAAFNQSNLRRILAGQLGYLTEWEKLPYNNSTGRWSSGYYDGAYNNNVYELYYHEFQPSQEHNFSVSGGSELLNYYFSGSLSNQDGLMKLNQDNLKRYNLSARISTQITTWMRLTYTMRFSRQDYIKPYYLTNSFYQDLLRRGWPNQPFYDPNGYLTDGPMPALSIKDGGNDKTLRDGLNQQAQITLEPIKDWVTFIELNSRINTRERKYYALPTYNHDIYGNPYTAQTATRSEVGQEFGKDDNWAINIYSNYKKEFGSGHNVTGLLGFQAENFTSNSFTTNKSGLLNNEYPEINLATGLDTEGNPVTPGSTGSRSDWATAGFFGRINYDYDGRYLFEVNLRYDATSRFRKDKRWGWFPSFSIGWNVAQEKFWEPLIEYVSFLKPRFSYGALGNQGGSSGNYPTYQTLSVSMRNSNWLINGDRQNTVGSPGLISSTLTWERVQQTNFGMDLAAFKSRLTAGFDYFIKKTFDMVGPAPQLPATLGAGVPRTNNTDMETTGFEMSLDWRDRFKNGFRYGIKLVLSDSKTKITRFPNVSGALSSYRAGQTVGEIWGYETKGIAKTQEEMDAHLASLPNGGQTQLGTQWMAGDIMFVDLNGDGTINSGSSTIGDPGDRKIIGYDIPRYNYGIDLTASYKDIDFRAFFQGIGKRDYMPGEQYFWGANSRGVWESTGFKPHMDYFRDDPEHYLGLNLDSYFHRPIFNSGKNQQTQTRYLQDASYVRLKTIQLGYALPKSLLDKTFLQRVRFFIAGENLWTFTKMFEVFDPEQVDGGWNGNVYPLSSSIAFGVNVNF